VAVVVLDILHKLVAEDQVVVVKVCHHIGREGAVPCRAGLLL
jgi:hypothetical protein